MRKIITLILSLTALANAEIPQLGRERLELLAELFQTTQARSWPTLDWQEAPLIATFDNGHIFAFQLESQEATWQKMDIEGIPVLFSKEDHWGMKDLHMQPWFPIEEQEAFVYRMNGQGEAVEDVRVLVHERFHRYQKEHFGHFAPPGVSRDHLNEENLTLIEIEDQLFRGFLAASKEEKGESLKDLVALHQLRRSLIDQETRMWENYQWRMEGLADYAASRAYGDEAGLLAMHPDVDPDFSVDQAIKWRHYLAGAAVGYALDYLGVKGWHKQVEQGAELSDLLVKHLPLSKMDRDMRIEKLKKRFKFKKRRRKMNEQISKYEEELDEMHKAYENKPGVVLYIGRPGGGISGGGSNEKLYYLADGSTVGLNDQSVSTTADGGWKLSTYGVSHLFQHSNGLREVKISGNCAIELDHVSWTVPEIMSEPKEFLFDSLVIDDEEVAFASENHLGVMVNEGDALLIKFVRTH